MAKQVKVEPKKSKAKAIRPEQGLLMTRSPKTNFIFAAALGLIYLGLFDQTPGQALIYGIGAFLFFNTVDYFILYRRINKTLKEDK